MGFQCQTAGPGRAFVQQAYDGLSYGEPQPGFHSAGPGRALSRRASTGPSVDSTGTDRAINRRALSHVIEIMHLWLSPI